MNVIVSTHTHVVALVVLLAVMAAMSAACCCGPGERAGGETGARWRGWVCAVSAGYVSDTPSRVRMYRVAPRTQPHPVFLQVRSPGVVLLFTAGSPRDTDLHRLPRGQ